MSENNKNFSINFVRCLMLWGDIEDQICKLFSTLITMHPIMSRRIFYSSTEFTVRHAMTRAVVSTRKFEDTEYQAFLMFLLSQADEYSRSRNQIAQGDVLDIWYQESKYHGQTVIFEGRQHWINDPPDDQVTDILKLEAMVKNYSALLALFIYANFDVPKDMAIDFHKYLDVARLLPNSAQHLPDFSILEEQLKPLLDNIKRARY